MRDVEGSASREGQAPQAQDTCALETRHYRGQEPQPQRWQHPSLQRKPLIEGASTLDPPVKDQRERKLELESSSGDATTGEPHCSGGSIKVLPSSTPAPRQQGVSNSANEPGKLGPGDLTKGSPLSKRTHTTIKEPTLRVGGQAVRQTPRANTHETKGPN